MLNTLRSSTLITRWVLVWFSLFMGVAVASPWIEPEGVQVVCTGTGGMKLVQVTGEDGEANNVSGLDCPLCATVTPPPVPMGLRFAPPSDFLHALEPMAAAHIAAVTSPPLPSRGPPIPKI